MVELVSISVQATTGRLATNENRKLMGCNDRCICTNSYTGSNCDLPRQSCGGVLEGPAGVLEFPPNGTSYPNNVTCTWIIRNSIATGSVINLTFQRFQIEKSVLCMFDYLEIYDGPSKEYKKVGRYCGNALPNKNGTFVSSFNSITLHFRSDISVSHDGFMLSWLTIDPGNGVHSSYCTLILFVLSLWWTDHKQNSRND